MAWIVTTPKSEMANSAAEAAQCIKDGGGYYFRRTIPFLRPVVGERIYYVEDGYIRGFAIVSNIVEGDSPFICHTTGRSWGRGRFAAMPSETWNWIKPIPMRGFQGWRRMPADIAAQVEIVGGWLDPKPEVK